ncbi:MAG: 3-alpha domain-containing protein, partial [Actinoplanes sp.]
REGEVRAGDEIVKVADGPEELTVAETDALLYLPGRSLEKVERALRIPALSPGWRESFRAIRDQPDPANGNAGLVAAVPPPAWAGFRALRVVAVEAESSTIISVRLADPDGAPVAAALPGQFLTVRLRPDAGRPDVVRSYSLSGRPGDAEYRISVKLEPHGLASEYVHSRVRTGDLVDVAAPRGSFVLRPGPGPVLLISGGVGATPVLAMLHALAEQGTSRQVWWIQAARNGAERPFATEAADLLARLPGAHSYVFLSRPRPEDRLGRDYDVAARLSTDVLRTLRLPADADAYLCGPAAFLTDVTAALAATGLPASRVHSEIFGSQPGLTPGIGAPSGRAPHPPEGEPGQGPAVSFARSDLSVPWTGGPASLLDLAEACDVPVRWSCRVGVCHTCETGLLSGEVDYTSDPVDPPADGNVLICSSRPRGEIVLDL